MPDIIQQSPVTTGKSVVTFKYVTPKRVTAGNVLLMSVVVSNNATLSFSDTGKNAYKTINAFSSTSLSLYHIICFAKATGTLTITGTLSKTANVTYNFLELANIDATAPVNSTTKISSSSAKTLTINGNADEDDSVLITLGLTTSQSSYGIGNPVPSYSYVGVNQSPTTSIGYQCAINSQSLSGSQTATWKFNLASSVAALMTIFNDAVDTTASSDPNGLIAWDTNATMSMPWQTVYYGK